MNLLSTPEAAARLNITPSLVRRYCRQGRLAGIRVGSRWVIPAGECDRFAEQERKVGYPKGKPRKP